MKYTIKRLAVACLYSMMAGGSLIGFLTVLGLGGKAIEAIDQEEAAEKESKK